jgi:molecular chaperone IbpA
MTRLTAADLTPFYKNSIGIDQLMSRILDNIDNSTRDTNYPPYNLLQTGENTFEVHVATAGFKEGEVLIRVQDNTLVITGEKQPEATPENYSYIHHGISSRKFIRTFSLAEYVEVIDAFSKDGVLVVRLERRIPDAALPKMIAIAYQN